MSPFKSIRDIVKDQAGAMTSYAIVDHFKNVELVKNVQCPAFFVHGQRDQLIHFSHS